MDPSESDATQLSGENDVAGFDDGENGSGKIQRYLFAEFTCTTEVNCKCDVYTFGLWMEWNAFEGSVGPSTLNSRRPGSARTCVDMIAKIAVS
nr:splicing factor U2af large subunit A-like isoform X2 [Ipomoea batatas]